MTMRHFAGLCLFGFFAFSSLPANAQDVSMRLARRRYESAVRMAAADNATQTAETTTTASSTNVAPSSPLSRFNAAIRMGAGVPGQASGGTQSGRPDPGPIALPAPTAVDTSSVQTPAVTANAPSQSTGGTQSGKLAAATGARAVAAPRKREIGVSVNTRLGFDSQSVALGNPAVAVQARRRIAQVDLSLAYPLSQRTNLSVTIPYIDQRSTYTSAFGSVRLRGRGIGDTGVYLQHALSPRSKGTQLTASVGLITPTGKSIFNAGPNELPTGVGFYQPVARLMLTKLRVPLQVYGAVDYGTSFARHINGARVTLPDSYGGELGFYYTMSPEFITHTSVSASKVTSPFINVPGATVGYLSQSLIYQANQSSALRASVDVGLTEDSTDTYLGLAYDRSF